MRSKFRSSLPLIASVVGFAAGLSGTAYAAGALGHWTLSGVTDAVVPVRLEPMLAMPRTRLVVAMEDARADLDAGRPWAAWQLLRGYLDTDEMTPTATLLAAEAAAGWSGWEEVRGLLRDQEWLERADSGRGLLLLGRAEEKGKNWERAAAAYARYAEVAAGRERGLAYARLARARAEAGDAPATAAAYAAAAPYLPEVSDWMQALQAEALADAGDPAAVALGAGVPRTSAAARRRAVLAESRGLLALGDTAGALERLGREVHALGAAGAADEAARLGVRRGELLSAAGRRMEAREVLRAVAASSAAPSELRLAAARHMGELTEHGTAAEELARTDAFVAAKRPGLAARALRAALAAGATDDGAARLRLGRLLYDAGDFAAARAALLDAAGRLPDAELAAEAEFYAARARYRAGERDAGIAELKRLVERRPGTAAAGSASFVLGDVSTKLGTALDHYRRAAAVERSPDAREALYRLGDRSLRDQDPAAAVRAWERYVARYPEGEATARIAYLAAGLHRRAGRAEAARAMYRAAVRAAPVSYYAIRAAERIGADPLAGGLTELRPWVGLAADPVDARAVLSRLAALEEAGLMGPWAEERDAAIQQLQGRPAALIALAEGLRDQGHPVDGIRLGLKLLAERQGAWDGRLLRVVYPFPYRDLVESEARRAGVDASLLAGLVRQESSFRPEARSWVGATGLAQIMPATGRWLADGIPDYEERLLAVPEVNLRMGAGYLADQVKRFDGARDLALAAYNAGPSRADRWRTELGYRDDVDQFRESIPFNETRNYVKIVLRNAAVYERLYGSGAAVMAAE